jgi:hypothetical protein
MRAVLMRSVGVTAVIDATTPAVIPTWGQGTGFWVGEGMFYLVKEEEADAVFRYGALKMVQIQDLQVRSC